MSFVISTHSFSVLPDLPSNTRAWYLTEEEKAFALERAKNLGKVRKYSFGMEAFCSCIL